MNSGLGSFFGFWFEYDHSFTHLDELSLVNSYFFYGDIVGSSDHEFHLHGLNGYERFAFQDALADFAVCFDNGSWHWTFDEISFAQSNISSFSIILRWNSISNRLSLQIKEIENTIWINQKWKFHLFIICSNYQLVIVFWIY